MNSFLEVSARTVWATPLCGVASSADAKKLWMNSRVSAFLLDTFLWASKEKYHGGTMKVFQVALGQNSPTTLIKTTTQKLILKIIHRIKLKEITYGFPTTQFENDKQNNQQLDGFRINTAGMTGNYFFSRTITNYSSNN